MSELESNTVRTMPERDLWVKVLRIQLLDALRPVIGTKCSVRKGKSLIKRRAISWLMSGGADYEEVCTLAGFDPGFIRRKFADGEITYAAIMRLEMDGATI
jgi:hypothetical protein